MKKVNSAEMRKTAGGLGYKCKKCGSWFLFKFQAGYHILFYPGHRF